VRAKTLVLGTNGYTPRLGYFSTGVFPLHSHCLATEPLSNEDWAKIGVTGPDGPRIAGFTDDLDRIAYGCFTTDGRMVFGGGSNAAYGYRYGGRTAFGDIPEGAWKAISERLWHYFPGLREKKITHRWTGTLGITMTRHCAMGATGTHKNVLYALGYSGHGVVLANLAGRILADVYAGEGEKWRDMPFYERHLGGIPPEPFRFVGYHVFTALTGRSPRRNEA
jgi:glycine/D-amino acid oxidase-like deaminating enzyme